MKYFFKILVLSLFVHCHDGDLTVDTIDFSTIDIVTCDTPTIEITLFFKIRNAEALFLEVPINLLRNEVTSKPISKKLDKTIKLTYRVFSQEVSNAYFCSAVSPASPSVLEEVEASSGAVIINTVKGNSSNTFVHTITLKNTVFIRDNGDKIINLLVENFGTITTTVSN